MSEKESQKKSKKEKETNLGVVTDKSENFGNWYSEVIVKSEFISYYDVSGCYILRPESYAIWERIQRWMDDEFKKIGIRNVYFPLFIPESNLNKEKEHIEGFAPEVAWVTKSGKTELENPIAIRPTSETVMYPYYSQWIRSHRDLPLRLNQWTNIVRWEFKNPTPFIRSREFLWQEGHTAFATKDEAVKEVHQILDIYRQAYEEMLAVPVIKGLKSENEKFAGSLFSTSVEAFIPETGRGIQGATSHCLGQNFSKMFDISFEAEDRTSQFVWQNSWGFTTRSIGVMIMVHGDNKGIVVPPKVSSIQVVVIPIINAKMKDEDKQNLFEKAEMIYKELIDNNIRATKDFRENYTPGWKYNYWELKGVPIRLELGPVDMQKKACVLVRRDTSKKLFDISWEDISKSVNDLLIKIQEDMFNKAKTKFDQCIQIVENWNDFMMTINQNKMALALWCDEIDVEEQIKKDSATDTQMGAKTLCLPFKESFNLPEIKEDAKCFFTGRPAKNWALFGRSY